MAQMNFGTRPPLLARSSVLPIDPNSPPTKPPMRQMPMGRPPTDFGTQPMPGMSFDRMPRATPTAINDLTPGGTVAMAPRPMGGLTATGMRPYDPNRRRREPGLR